MIVRRNSKAGVAHLDDGGACRGVDKNVDVTSDRCELDRIRDQVVEQLREPRGIADNRFRTRRGEAELDAGRLCSRLCCLNAVVYERNEFHVDPIEGELALLSLRDQEQVADEMEQAIRVAAYDLEISAGLRRQLLGVIHDQLEVAANRREGRSQFV